MQEEKIRLNKWLATNGICSRREGDQWIANGEVSVNGVIAIMGQRVESNETIVVKGKTYRESDIEQREKIVLAYYKPVGVNCTEKDANAEKTVIEALQFPTRVTYAGRLDKDSEGLLIMTNDGDLIQSMMKASNDHEKEYIVTVDKPITMHFLIKMREGIYLEELDVTTRPCIVEQLEERTFRIILTQGYNRQIRRMCQIVGYEVEKLKRIRVVNISLDGLKSGEYREIIGKEKKSLYQKIGVVLDEK